MRAKIILETPTGEVEVATFKAAADAFSCAALLQAKVNPDTHTYWVEFKEKGTNKRSRPQSLRSVINHTTPETYKHLKETL